MAIHGLYIMGIIIFTLAPDRNNLREGSLIWGPKILEGLSHHRGEGIVSSWQQESVTEAMDITSHQEAETRQEAGILYNL